MNKLTPKQEKFANLYVELGNASEAYRKSYNVKASTTTESVNVQASTLLADLNISLRVAELQESVKETHSITRDYIVKGLLEIISDADYTFNLGKDSKLTKDDSKAFYRIMQQTKNTDKLRALETLAKMLGLNEPEKHEHKIEQIEIIEKKR
jgi:phage terminase small subunit